MYAIGKSKTSGKYIVVSSSRYIDQDDIPLPDIKIISMLFTESIYVQSALFCSLIKSELFMDRLPNVPIKKITAFNWLYYVYKLAIIKTKMPKDFGPLHDLLAQEREANK